MNYTLVEGDVVLVNKTAYGARLPITPLSVHIGSNKFYVDWIQIPYVRLPGYAAVKHNDIIVFNLPTETEFPIDEKKEAIKRCIGLPGDTITIKAGDVYINNTYINEENSVKWFSVKIKGTDTSGLKDLVSEADLAVLSSGGNEIYTSSQSAASLIKCHTVLSVEKRSIEKENYSPTFFPNNPQIKWNPDNLGPYYIPEKGKSIDLNSNNLILYQYIIEKYEGNTMTYKNDSVFINDTYTKTYTFKMDYYFVAGDNRYNSIDSRYWGPIPEDHLIGKAEFLLFSSPKPVFKKTKRSFKSLN